MRTVWPNTGDELSNDGEKFVQKNCKHCGNRRCKFIGVRSPMFCEKCAARYDSNDLLDAVKVENGNTHVALIRKEHGQQCEKKKVLNDDGSPLRDDQVCKFGDGCKFCHAGEEGCKSVTLFTFTFQNSSISEVPFVQTRKF